MFTFFFMNKTFATSFCLRIIMIFARLIMYNSHINENLKYFRTTLNNIDRLKNVFIKFRFINKRIKRRHFNFSKFHVMIYYVKNIRYFENAIEINKFYERNAHKFIIKNYYDRINRNFDFNEQILFHNIRRHNLLIINDVLLHAHFNFVTTTNKKKLFMSIRYRKIQSNWKFENYTNQMTKIIAFWNLNIEHLIRVNDSKCVKRK